MIDETTTMIIHGLDNLSLKKKLSENYRANNAFFNRFDFFEKKLEKNNHRQCLQKILHIASLIGY